MLFSELVADIKESLKDIPQAEASASRYIEGSILSFHDHNGVRMAAVLPFFGRPHNDIPDVLPCPDARFSVGDTVTIDILHSSKPPYHAIVTEAK